MRDTAKSDTATSRAERAYLARCRYRFRLACLSFAVAFVLIGGRLVTLGFAEEDLVSGSLRDISSTVHRPDILDRRGRLLATDIKGATLYADPAKVIDVDELVEQVTRLLSPHKRPREVRLVPALPRNAMGKVQKARLG